MLLSGNFNVRSRLRSIRSLARWTSADGTGASPVGAHAGLEAPLLVVEISSRVTDMSMPGSRVVAAVTAVGDVFELRKDWEVMRLLRACSLRADAVALGASAPSVTDWVQSANAHIQAKLADLKLPFGSPQVKTLAVFWPT